MCRLLVLIGMLIVSIGQGGDALAFDNWTTRRDAGVVRQAQDFSCGVAALATLLTYYYGDEVSERELLLRLFPERSGGTRSAPGAVPSVSFLDLASLARERGYRALGISLDRRDLRKLRHPVIVRLDLDGSAHFSLLRFVSERGGVVLADPSWGTRHLTADAFGHLFSDEAEARGRVLFVAPREADSGDRKYREVPPRRFFMAPPPRPLRPSLPPRT